jgi:hypothetical protein
MAVSLSPVFGAAAQLLDNRGRVLPNGKVWVYLAGSLTATDTWVDNTQTTKNTNPIVADASGRLPQAVWLDTSLSYKFIVTDSTGVQYGISWDNISGVGASTASTVGEWVPTALTPTYIDSSSFTVPGNVTSTFQTGRRIQYICTAGTLYGQVASSSFGSGVTTVVIYPDGAGLDSGLSAVNLGLLTPSGAGAQFAGIRSANSYSVPHVALGGAPDATAQFAIDSSTTRDGWSAGGGVAWGAQITRAVDNNNTGVANPLDHTIRVNVSIANTVTVDCREWGITCVMEDFSNTNAVSVAVTGVSRRHYGNSRIWGGQFVAVDYVDNTGLPTSTHNCYGTEIDMEGDGDDSYQRRYTLYLNSYRSDASLGHTGTVGDNRHWAALRINASAADLWRGIEIYSPGSAEIDKAIVIASQGSEGIHLDGQFTGYGILMSSSVTCGTAAFADSSTSHHGFYALGTYTTAAFRMLEDNWMLLGNDPTSSSQVRFRFNSATRKVEFYLGATRFGYVDITAADHAM